MSRRFTTYELEELAEERCVHDHYLYRVGERRWFDNGPYEYEPCITCLQAAYEQMMNLLIEAWHSSRSGMSLPEWLFITGEEYAKWLERGPQYVVMVGTDADDTTGSSTEETQ
jgi:hypothetical protein